MSRALAAVLAVATAGCNLAKDITAPSTGTEPETVVLSETTRFAGMLRVKVRGELTRSPYFVKPGAFSCPPDGPACLASGWYEAGVAYYYQPHVITWDAGLASQVAAHETCHAIEYGHNDKHKACMASVGAVPSYAIGGMPCLTITTW